MRCWDTKFGRLVPRLLVVMAARPSDCAGRVSVLPYTKKESAETDMLNHSYPLSWTTVVVDEGFDLGLPL